MKLTAKRIVALLSAAVICPVISGCEKASTSSDASSTTVTTVAEVDSLFNEPGKLPIVKEPITLTAAIKENGLVTDYNDNAYTKWIAEQTGITLEFTAYPTKDEEAKQKIELDIASGGKLPGILFEFGFNDVARANYGRDGVFLDTTEFLKNDAYYFKKGLESIDDGKDLEEKMWKQKVSSDGKLYGMPGLNQGLSNQWDGRWYINAEWLKKLNLEYPKTTDELYTVLKAFKEKDPNGNGKADEIPLVGSNNGWRQQPQAIILNSFLYCPYDYKLVNDGEISLAYTQDAYREGLKYINKLVEEDLFSPISFTQDGSQLKALLDSPADQASTVGLFAGSPTGLFTADNAKKLEYSGDFDIISGPEGVAYTPCTPNYIGLASYITKDCENPDAAMRVLDFLYSEEASIRGRYGEKGVNWDYAEAGSKGLFESIGVKALFWQDNSVWGAANNTIWGISNQVFLPVRISEGTEASKILADPLASLGMISKAVTHLVGHAPDEILEPLLYTEDELTEFTELETVINTYKDEARVRFMTGDLDINNDKDWAAYNKELKDMGFERYVEIMQTAYDRLYK